MPLKKLFPVVEELSEEQRKTALKNVLRDGVVSQAMASLTGSAILVAFAVELGASNAVIGILAAIPQFAQLVQLPVVALVRKVQNRRLISVIASSVGRTIWLVLAVVLYAGTTGTTAQSMLIFSLFVSSVMAAVSNCGWNSWMHDLVPTNQLGAFFGKRFSLATAGGVAVSVLAGWFLDQFAPGIFANILHAYAVIFGVAFVFGMTGVIFVSRVPEPRFEVVEESMTAAIVKPFRDTNFRNLIHFMASWQFALSLAAPFFTVYMLRRLEISLLWVIALVALGRLVNIVFLRVWGRFSDVISYKSVIAVAAPLCMICIFSWTFTTLPEKHALTLPMLVVLHALMGIAMAGITLATGNIGLKLAPAGEGTSYLAALNFVNAFAAGVAPLVSGRLVDFFVERKLSWTIRYSGPKGETVLGLLDFQQWDFLFFISFVIGLYAVHRLSLIVEAGEVEERVVVAELMAALGRELRDFSSVASIRNIVNLVPFTDRRSRRRRSF